MIRRFIKWGAIAAVGLLIGVSLYGAYLYQQIRGVAVQDEAQQADAILVLGAAQYNGRPSPVLKARLDHAFNLYMKGYADSVITTGGYGPDPNFSEAHVSTQYLIEHGIDASKIITEQGSGTTADSVRAAATLMQSNGWKTALVVSDGFHLFRLKTMLADNGIVAYTSPAPNSPIETASSERFWHSMREVLLVSVYRLMDL